MTNSTLSRPDPVRPFERIHALDVIRGFALLGVLLGNINSSLPNPLRGIAIGFANEDAWLAESLGWFFSIFIDNSFYTMFSLLFGAGFVIFIDRARSHGANSEILIFRRLVALLLIGAAHSILIWWGDILALYACLGMLLLAFINVPAQRLWKWGVAFYLLPLAWPWLSYFLQADPGSAEAAAIAAAREARLAAAKAAVAVYTTGTWWEVAQLRLEDVLWMWRYASHASYGPKALGMFLIGAAIARSGLLSSLGQYRSALRRMGWIGFAVGVPLAVLARLIPNSLVGPITTGSISDALICLAYAATLTLVVQGNRMARLTRSLAAIGRMALTNYLMQSLVFTWIFCGYGLGLGDSLGQTATILLALVFFGMQIAFSRWWLAGRQFGPMEWVWRTMTYGQAPSPRMMPKPA